MLARCLFVVVSCLLGSACFAHGKDGHVEQMKKVFNGYDGQYEGVKKDEDDEKVSFYRYYERFTFELDEWKRKNKRTLCDYVRDVLRKKYQCDELHVPKNRHRIYGHMGFMGKDFIPADSKCLNALEQQHKGAVELVDSVWKEEFCPRHYKLAGEIFSMSPSDGRVQAFSSIVHCVHLLGDRETVDVNSVAPLRDIVREIKMQAQVLFGHEQGQEIGYVLIKASDTPGSENDKATAVMKRLIELRLGTRLHNKYGNRIENKPGCQWSGERDVGTSKKE